MKYLRDREPGRDWFRLFKLVLWLVFVMVMVACQRAEPARDETLPTEIIQPMNEEISPTEVISPTNEALLDSNKTRTPFPSKNDIWVDGDTGDDENDGLTPTNALRTVQRAADLATPGALVHIMPGAYRETVRPAMSGTADEPVRYLAENGPGTVSIRGSEASQSLTWKPLMENTIGLPPTVDPTNLYYTDLSAWGLQGPPRFIVELDDNGDIVARLPLAREPDWDVKTDWKYHEFWWAADGGQDMAGCNPQTNPDPTDCDVDSRSKTQLTDRTHDTEPFGIEPGNLTTLGDLAGATLVSLDTSQGHYVYRRTIISHDVLAGRVTVDEDCQISGEPGLGWGSKYYVENKPYLLDTPGEWWYDPDSAYLYLWPLTPSNPSTLNIEISKRENGVILTNLSYTILDGLTIEFFNESAVSQSNNATEKSYSNIVRNALLQYSNRGIYLYQNASGDVDELTDGFTLENSEIAYTDSHGIYMHYGWDKRSDLASFTHAGITNTSIRGNELHDLGFRSDMNTAIGALFVRADRLRFENNNVYNVAHNGVQFSRSVIQSPNEWGFEPDEIKTGEILIKDNIFEKSCQLTTDCGALKFWGDLPNEHVFRDVLVTGNIFRDTFGWTYISEKRGRWSGGADSNVQGMGGRGFYVDIASGIHAYRNIAYNNAFAGYVLNGTWEDGDIVYYNNIAANSLYGFRFGGSGVEAHVDLNTQMVNNIIVNNEGHGIWYRDAESYLESLAFDHNLYYNNGWRSPDEGGLYGPGEMIISRRGRPNEYFQSLSDIQNNTLWESNGVEGDPGFRDYDLDDHDLFDGSWPDFNISAASTNIVDLGTIGLPASLDKLLVDFGVQDVRFGKAFDIGRYEATDVTSTSSGE